MATKTIPTASKVMLIKVKRLRRTMSHQERPLASGTALPPSLVRRAWASDSLRPVSAPTSATIAAPLVASDVPAIVSPESRHHGRPRPDAIETVTEYARYRHGEAVGLGLLAALRLSGQPGLRDEVRELLAANGLPTE